MKRRNAVSSLLLIATLLLCGCQQSPNQSVVVSKNDGSFHAGVIQSAADINPGEIFEWQIQYSELFASTDGTVEFALSIDQNAVRSAVPVVEVVPHYFTEADAERISRVLFGADATFYEEIPRLAPEQDVMSRGEIEDIIQLLAQYTNSDTLHSLVGTAVSVDELKALILHYTEMCEMMPDEDRRTRAKWTFCPADHYTYSAAQIEEKNRDVSNSNSEIAVRTTVDGVPYTIRYTIRDKADFKLSHLSVYPNSHIDSSNLLKFHYETQLLCTEKPTEEQIEAIRKKAQSMLDQMEVGEWLVDQVNVEAAQRGAHTTYRVRVTAVPVIQDIPAVRRPQLDNLKSEEAYASNYYMTDVYFDFSADGKLYRFDMLSPIDVKEVLNENVATLSIDELLDVAKKQLSLSDYQAYGLSGEALQMDEQSVGEKFVCKVNLCEMEYGMTRVKVPDTDASYYYVPALVLYGSVDYCGAESGQIYASSGESFASSRVIPLLALNAVDGSVIEMTNG